MIEFRNVTKIYEDGLTALEDLNLQIHDGEFVFVVGPSDAGKSTLFRLLTCETKPTSGSVLVDEWDLSAIKRKKVPYYRRKLGILFRDFRLFPEKTVFENVALALRVQGEHSAGMRMKSVAALRMVELPDAGKKRPRQLSAIDQQRVALARALAGGPGIIVADEPTGNLDPIQAKEFIELLMRIQSRYQKTVLVFTNSKEFAEEFGQRILYLSHGAIVEDRSADLSEDDKLTQAVNAYGERSDRLDSDDGTQSLDDSDLSGVADTTQVFTAIDLATAAQADPSGASEDTHLFDAVPMPEMTEDTCSFDAVPIPEMTEDTCSFDAVPMPEVTEDTCSFDAVPMPEMTEDTCSFDAIKLPETEDLLKQIAEETAAPTDSTDLPTAPISDSEESQVRAEDAVSVLAEISIPTTLTLDDLAAMDSHETIEEATEATKEEDSMASPEALPSANTDDRQRGESDAQTSTSKEVEISQLADSGLVNAVLQLLAGADQEALDVADSDVQRKINDVTISRDWQSEQSEASSGEDEQ